VGDSGLDAVIGTGVQPRPVIGGVAGLDDGALRPQADVEPSADGPAANDTVEGDCLFHGPPVLNALESTSRPRLEDPFPDNEALNNGLGTLVSTLRTS